MENIIEEDFRTVMLEAENDQQRDMILSNKDFLSAISEEEIDSFFSSGFAYLISFALLLVYAVSVSLLSLCLSKQINLLYSFLLVNIQLNPVN